MSYKNPSRLPPDHLRLLSSLASRRAFLRWGAALGALTACQTHELSSRSPWETEQRLPQFDGRGRSVLILGAGLSGLCAAYELDQMGFAVTVLEKSKRSGGRIWTLSEAFEDGAFCELGASHIPDCHKLPLDYAKKFGLELLTLDGPDRESAVDSGQLYALQSFPFLGDPTRSNWPYGAGQMSAGRIREWDALTAIAYLRQITDSESALQGIKSQRGSEIEKQSALFWLARAYLQRSWRRSYRIAGGTQKLTERFAQKLSTTASIEWLADVQRITQNEQGVLVHALQKGELRSFTADLLISTLPLDGLKAIEWNPGLSAGKRAASSDVKMLPFTRVNLQFKQRFWDKAQQRLRSAAALQPDLVIDTFGDFMGPMPPKNRKSKASAFSILTCDSQSENALRLGDREPKERVRIALDELAKIFPEAKAHFVNGMSWVWHKQDGIGGAWATYRPDQVDHYLETRKPEGRIVFAGDHTTLEPGWMQGALSSAHRALTDIAELRLVPLQVPIR